jgi:hypothetical protein
MHGYFRRIVALAIGVGWLFGSDFASAQNWPTPSA